MHYSNRLENCSSTLINQIEIVIVVVIAHVDYTKHSDVFNYKGTLLAMVNDIGLILFILASIYGISISELIMYFVY